MIRIYKTGAQGKPWIKTFNEIINGMKSVNTEVSGAIIQDCKEALKRMKETGKLYASDCETDKMLHSGNCIYEGIMFNLYKF